MGIAAEIKNEPTTEYENQDLNQREEKMRRRITQRKCQTIVAKNNLEKEFKKEILEGRIKEEREFMLDKDPLAEAVMAYVAEGKTQLEIKEENLVKLEEEKKKSIENRIRERKRKKEKDLKKLQ